MKTKEPTQGDKDTPTIDKFKWVVGKTYVCTNSSSCGYKVGGTYKCYQNELGQKCLKASDGFEDLCSMLVSSFKESIENILSVAKEGLEE